MIKRLTPLILLLAFVISPSLALAEDAAQKGPPATLCQSTRVCLAMSDAVGGATSSQGGVAMQAGADLYLEAMTAVAKKDFTLSKAKFEEAAASLSGENQAIALKMADFFGRMSPQITQKKLSLSDQWVTLGEVKEESRFWHLYQFSNYGASILRLAVKGEKPLDELAVAMGQDMFEKKMVIKNREGYISKPNTTIPGVVSQIRMWYCDKDDTTNIVYATDGYGKNVKMDFDPVQLILDEMGWSFENVKCSREFPLWAWVAVILGAVTFVFHILYRFVWRRLQIKDKIRDKWQKDRVMEKPAKEELVEKKGVLRKILNWARRRIIFLFIVVPIIICLLLLLWLLSPVVLR